MHGGIELVKRAERICGTFVRRGGKDLGVDDADAGVP